MKIEKRLEAMGVKLPMPEGASYYGATYGTMKPFHIVGNVLHLSGHVPCDINGDPVHPGRLGETVTLEQGIAAARLTGINALAGMKQALGDLDRVTGLIKSLCFVAAAPTFVDVHKVSSGMTDFLAEVLGHDIGIGGRATIGIQVLARGQPLRDLDEVEFR